VPACGLRRTGSEGGHKLPSASLGSRAQGCRAQKFPEATAAPESDEAFSGDWASRPASSKLKPECSPIP